MKIEKIEIKDFLQFKDLELDLTYPKGHQKEGQPLDKICIIGQSGVGKTNLLKIIIDNNNHIDNIKTTFKDIYESKKIYLLGADNSRYNSSGKVITYLANGAWSILIEKMNNYNDERLKYTDKLSNKLLNIEDYEKKDFQREMKEWKEENENILDKISDKLNIILIKFNLQLEKTDKNQQSYNDLIFKDLSNGNIIEYNNLSTGTKNIISTFIPLKIHNPKDSIIIIDEPENSFYPDIQRMLTELYMEVGENNQLIMATHSPLIASSFEPWEVVELKFDKNNQVYRELYYKGDNHIDNYTLDPRLLTWTGILTKVFDLEDDSNIDRKKELMRYARLKAKIKRLDDSLEEEEELIKLSQKLGLSN